MKVLLMKSCKSSMNHRALFSYLQNGLGGEQVKHSLMIQKATGKADHHNYKLCLRLQESGYYLGSVKYNGRTISPQNFALICLTGEENL